MNLNISILIGRLVDNVKYTPPKEGKKARAWFRLAVNRFAKKGKPQEADYFNCVAWGVHATNMATYTERGQTVVIVGETRTRSTQRADGTWDNYSEVHLNSVVFGPKSEKASRSILKSSPSVPLPSNPEADETTKQNIAEMVSGMTPETFQVLQSMLPAVLLNNVKE